MNPNTQIENMVGTWTHLQQQWWNNWLSSLPANPVSWWTQMYRTPLEISEEIVKLGLQTQAGYTRVCMKGLRLSKGTPKSLVQWLEQLEAVSENSTDAQREAWNAWFRAAEDWDPTRPSIVQSDSVENLSQVWQDATRKTLEMQAGWFSSMVPWLQATAPEESEKKASARKMTETRSAA